ncbi:hypothetical protein [Nocardia sp. alder85J]|uniref:hypothetical protein n=1 Tax=Nocardia sp. alder85J TaxID=2862949 RepID=UPI001CD2434F|nr:hypothetical protein [Nocardia sp. alder85J]MCX4095500.1 hypothetical protein [Nocardia sp. alder85J]
MATLQVDLEVLGRLGAAVRELAAVTAELRPIPGAEPGRALLSAATAAAIERDVLVGTLIPAVRAHLEQVADVMGHVSREFVAADESNAAAILDEYRRSLDQRA